MCLFRKTFKYRENISNNRLCEIQESSLKLYIRYITCLCSMSLILFRIPENGDNFTKIAQKIVKSKYFVCI